MRPRRYPMERAFTNSDASLGARLPSSDLVTLRNLLKDPVGASWDSSAPASCAVSGQRLKFRRKFGDGSGNISVPGPRPLAPELPPPFGLRMEPSTPALGVQKKMSPSTGSPLELLGPNLGHHDPRSCH